MLPNNNSLPKGKKVLDGDESKNMDFVPMGI